MKSPTPVFRNLLAPFSSRLALYLYKRLLIAIPVLIGITLLDFFIMTMAGSPLEMLRGPRVSQAVLDAKEIELGLDQPFFTQYFVWLKQLLRGNLGYSIKSYEPVAQLIGRYIGPTLLLMGSSLLLSLLISIPAGIYSAVKQYSKMDYAIVTGSFVGTSIPSFFLALMMVYVFHVQLGWFPGGGMKTLGFESDGIDLLWHLTMPMLVLAISTTGSNIRYIRAAVLEILQKDYLRTAKAKGIGRRRLIYKHALRNALVPIITVIGMQIPSLFGGAVIVEQVFSWPGLGLMTMKAILDRDFPVIMAVCLLSALVVLVVNLLTDLFYAIADPTIHYE